jgi:hypothetical protein
VVGQRHASVTLSPGKNPATRCVGGYVDTRFGMHGCRNFHPHRGSNLKPPSPYRVAVLTTLRQPTCSTSVTQILFTQDSAFSGSFAKLRKATLASRSLSFCMSVRLSVSVSVRMEQFGFHWTGFHEIGCLSIFRKSVEKIQVSLNLTRITGT